MAVATRPDVLAPILEVVDIRKSYGGVAALGGCSLAVAEHSVTGIIGPNGSGKTTLFDIMTGYQRADGGSVYFAGREVRRADPCALYHRGLTRTFQQARVFSQLTVLQNLAVGRSQAWRGLLRHPLNTKDRARAEEVLERFGLTRLGSLRAEECSYGQRRLLEFASVLIGKPRVVLLDEPTAGVNPVMTATLERHVREMHAEGVTFLIVEHNLDFLMRLCDLIIVLDQGVKIAEGSPDAIRSDPRVLDAYLGS